MTRRVSGARGTGCARSRAAGARIPRTSRSTARAPRTFLARHAARPHRPPTATPSGTGAATLGRVRIPTATLDVVAADHLAAFYGGLLGLVVEGGDDALTVAVGGARLVLRAAPHPVGLHHVAFGVAHDRFDAAERWLAGRVPLLEAAGATRVQWDFWRAEAIYAVDPAGLVLAELIAFADLPADGRRGAFSADKCAASPRSAWQSRTCQAPLPRSPRSARRLGGTREPRLRRARRSWREPDRRAARTALVPDRRSGRRQRPGRGRVCGRRRGRRRRRRPRRALPAVSGGHPWDAELAVDAELARILIARRFPELAEASIRPLDAGWDNAVLVVDGRLAVRFPRRAIAVPGIERELAVSARTVAAAADPGAAPRRRAERRLPVAVRRDAAPARLRARRVPRRARRPDAARRAARRLPALPARPGPGRRRRSGRRAPARSHGPRRSRASRRGCARAPRRGGAARSARPRRARRRAAPCRRAAVVDDVRARPRRPPPAPPARRRRSAERRDRLGRRLPGRPVDRPVARVLRVRAGRPRALPRRLRNRRRGPPPAGAGARDRPLHPPRALRLPRRPRPAPRRGRRGAAPGGARRVSRAGCAGRPRTAWPSGCSA